MTTATILIFAHLGHVLVDLPIFAGPFFAICLWLGLTTYRARRRGKLSEPKHRRETST